MEKFTWERGPFDRCAGCGEIALGILSVKGNLLTKRCTKCRRTVEICLPALNKRAIYLDQFMFSALYNVKSAGTLPKGHETFIREAYSLLRKCVLLQQVFLPYSDIHHEETTVFHSSMELRSVCQFFGGDVSLKSRVHIKLLQTLAFAEAFFEGSEPVLEFDLDEVTESSRNDWLPVIYVGVRADYRQFADAIRRIRGETAAEVTQLAATWAAAKPEFEVVLENEFSSIGPTKLESLSRWCQETLNPDPNDLMALLNSSARPISREYRELCRMLDGCSVPESKRLERIVEFWHWERLREIPHQRIFVYLIAAVARRVARGERKIVDQGLINDLNTISTYAPYVDALFIDKSCAAMLAEEPLATDLNYKALTFSLRDTGAFLDYLREIEANTPVEVRVLAESIYGIT